jgi:carotenoid 1,2-hydratase
MGAPRFDQQVAPGAYLWWYIDAISDDGQYGLTIIAFVGSVFSPYYAKAIKRGKASANNHCAINVALYSRSGKHWTMTERGHQSIERDATHFEIGPSSLHWNGSALEIHINERGAPLPFPVRGIVRVHPRALSTYSTALDDGGLHHWGPLAPCARVEVELNNPSLKWKGHAYLDSNEGAEPIDRPFREWDWSRATLSDGSTAIIYDVQQKQGKDRLLGLRFKPDGTHTTFTPPSRQILPLTAWRIPRRMRSEGDKRVEVMSMLEDTPFYERSILKTRLFGEDVISMHETLNVPRLTSPIVQWMLKWRMPRFG